MDAFLNQISCTVRICKAEPWVRFRKWVLQPPASRQVGRREGSPVSGEDVQLPSPFLPHITADTEGPETEILGTPKTTSVIPCFPISSLSDDHGHGHRQSWAPCCFKRCPQIISFDSRDDLQKQVLCLVLRIVKVMSCCQNPVFLWVNTRACS